MTALISNISFVALIVISCIWCSSIIRRIVNTKIKARFIAVSVSVSAISVINLLNFGDIEHSLAEQILMLINLILLAVIAVCAISLMVFTIKARKSKSMPVLPIIAFALIVIYFALHNMDVPIISASPFFAVIGALILLFCEGFIGPRFIKTEADYRVMFEHSNLPTIITDRKANIIYRTKAPVPNGNIIKCAIKNGVDYKPDENFIVTAQEIDGGYAIFTKEVRELNMLLDELNETSQKLRTNNGLIAREEEIRQDLTKAKILNKLYEESVKICTQKLGFVSGIIRALPEDKLFRDRMIIRAKLLTYYVRNKFELISLYEQNGSVSNDKISDILAEKENILKEIIRDFGIEYSVLNQADIRITTLILDWIESVCEFALIFPEPNLKIELDCNSRISLKIELNNLDARKKFDADKELIRKTSRYNGELKMDIFSSRVSINIVLPNDLNSMQEVL